MVSVRRLLVGSVLVSAALVVGSVSPAYAGGPVPSGPSATSESPTSVAPLPVAKAKSFATQGPANAAGAPAGLPAVPAPKKPVTFSPPTGSAFSPVTSVPVAYGADYTLFRNADGSETKELSSTPVNIQHQDGSWGPIGTSVAADSATGGFKVANNPLNPTFAPSVGGGAGFTVDSNSHPVTISLQGAAPAAGARPSKALVAGGGSVRIFV